MSITGSACGEIHGQTQLRRLFLLRELGSAQGRVRRHAPLWAPHMPCFGSWVVRQRRSVPQSQGYARGQVELRQNPADVVFDGALRQDEPPRDRAIAHPLGDQRRHIGLARGERPGRPRRTRAAPRADRPAAPRRTSRQLKGSGGRARGGSRERGGLTAASSASTYADPGHADSRCSSAALRSPSTGQAAGVPTAGEEGCAPRCGHSPTPRPAARTSSRPSSSTPTAASPTSSSMSGTPSGSTSPKMLYSPTAR